VDVSTTIAASWDASLVTTVSPCIGASLLAAPSARKSPGSPPDGDGAFVVQDVTETSMATTAAPAKVNATRIVDRTISQKGALPQRGLT
jgi:hypothetical protein